MKTVYEVQTRLKGTARNWGVYTTIAKNLDEAIKKTERHLKNNKATTTEVEEIDEVRAIAVIDF